MKRMMATFSGPSGRRKVPVREVTLKWLEDSASTKLEHIKFEEEKDEALELE